MQGQTQSHRVPSAPLSAQVGVFGKPGAVEGVPPACLTSPSKLGPYFGVLSETQEGSVCPLAHQARMVVGLSLTLGPAGEGGRPWPRVPVVSWAAGFLRVRPWCLAGCLLWQKSDV